MYKYILGGLTLLAPNLVGYNLPLPSNHKPSSLERKEIIKKHLQKNNCYSSDWYICYLDEICSHYTCRELNELLKTTISTITQYIEPQYYIEIGDYKIIAEKIKLPKKSFFQRHKQKLLQETIKITICCILYVSARIVFKKIKKNFIK